MVISRRQRRSAADASRIRNVKSPGRRTDPDQAASPSIAAGREPKPRPSELHLRGPEKRTTVEGSAKSGKTWIMTRGCGCRQTGRKTKMEVKKKAENVMKAEQIFELNSTATKLLSPPSRGSPQVTTGGQIVFGQSLDIFQS